MTTRKSEVLVFALIVGSSLVLEQARATPSSDMLLITENSSSSLSVTWDGTVITPTLVSADHWTFTLPVAVHLGSGEGSFGSPDGASIQEPDGVGWNNVFTSTTVSAPDTTLVDVQSDSSTTSPFALPLTDGVSGVAGTDASGLPIDLTFHDAGDGTRSTVPDGGSTSALFGAAVCGLAWLRSKIGGPGPRV